MRATGCSIAIRHGRVMPDCKFQDIPSFSQKTLKPIVKFPSSNMPIKCPICSQVGIKPSDVFIPKYNMLEHYKQVHDMDYEQGAVEELEGYVVAMEEMSKVTDKFPIKVPELD